MIGRLKGRIQAGVAMIGRASVFGSLGAPYVPPPPPVTTYATFNPADKSANVTLSQGDLRMTATTAAYGSARSTISKTSGKWYWEVTCLGNSFGSTVSLVGVAIAGALPGGRSDYGDTGWGYENFAGSKSHSAAMTAYGATWTTGAVLGIAVDVDAGTVEFFKNGISQGVAFTGVGQPTFAVGTTYSSDILQANFGATAFTYTPPTGYNAGLYTIT